jgi:hypothetical protein
MAMRSGSYKNIVARVVYENDDFDVELVTGKMHHKPCLRGPRGDVLCAYSVAIHHDGYTDPEVMTVQDINDIRNRSDGFKKAAVNPWKTDWSEMARKSVLKRHCKRLDMPADASRALAEEDDSAQPLAIAAPIDVHALPVVGGQAAQALTAEPVESVNSLASVPGLGKTIITRCEARGIDTPQKLWDAIEAGNKPSGLKTSVVDYLREQFGEPESEPDSDMSDFEIETIQALANRIREAPVAPVDYICACLVDEKRAADEDEAFAKFSAALDASGVAYTEASAEQLAAAWYSV